MIKRIAASLFSMSRSSTRIFTSFLGQHYPEDKSATILRNSGKYVLTGPDDEDTTVL
jgi:hypothetical protein